MVAHVSNTYDRPTPFAPVSTGNLDTAQTPYAGRTASWVALEDGEVSPVMLVTAPGDLTTADTVVTDRLGYRVAKRTLDVVVAAVGLLLLSPVLLLIAMLIVMTSPGPAIFRQTRCGKDGTPFTCYKFRTMVTDAELMKLQLLHLNEVPGPVFKIRRDPRVTPLGRWLRKFSLDEIPQLVNVLRGEMSLVGPRPALPQEVDCYSPEQSIRLLVKPGLTCLWQVSGRSDLPFEQWVRLDAEYVRRQSFWLDLTILLRTVPAVITGRGAF